MKWTSQLKVHPLIGCMTLSVQLPTKFTGCPEVNLASVNGCVIVAITEEGTILTMVASMVLLTSCQTPSTQTVWSTARSLNVAAWPSSRKMVLSSVKTVVMYE